MTTTRVTSLSKAELAKLVAVHPAHVYPPEDVLRRWSKDELLASYLELTGHWVVSR